MSELLQDIRRAATFVALLAAISLIIRAQSQQPASVSNIQDLQRRVDLVEERNRHLDELVKATTDASRTFITVLSVIIGVVVGVQSIFQGLNLHHQWARDSDRDLRDKENEKVSNVGAKAVSEVLTVVKDTMNTRLIQEKKAKNEAAEAKEEVRTIRGDLARMVTHFERLARTEHQKIESLAVQLAKVRRHDFKEDPGRLSDFAQHYDEYMDNLQPLAPEDLKFSAKVVYVRGIASHYMSSPELVKTYLSDVVARNLPETGETEFEHRRRLANAYYYLGVNESNFGNYTDAMGLLERANALDLDSRDLLTRIVTAECYIFSDQLDRALQYVNTDIRKRIEELKERGEFRSYHVPLQVRTELLEANIIFVEGREDWLVRAQSLLERACALDPDSYYAASSLAQVYVTASDQRAPALFDKAYESIMRRRHLETTSEVRSRILLFMVAGMCSKMGSDQIKKRMPEEFLEEAKSLLDRLPHRQAEESTVFSPVSKLNEDRNTLATHIGLIQSGQVLVGKKRT